jgi:lipoate-protein ligase A
MRLPRQDTRMTLSAEHPREALARDEAMLDAVQPGAEPLVRWYTPSAPALVLGLALRQRADEVVDRARCLAAGVEVLERRAGGGAVLVDDGMVCCSVCVALPDARVGDDLTESYRWLGEQFGAWLGLRRVDVAEARADVAALKARSDPLGRVLRDVCYGALSPHEVVNDHAAKVVGLAQIRRRHAALYQAGILLRDQSALADLLRVPDEATREALRAELRKRSAGVSADLIQPEQFLQPGRQTRVPG